MPCVYVSPSSAARDECTLDYRIRLPCCTAGPHPRIFFFGLGS